MKIIVKGVPVGKIHFLGMEAGTGSTYRLMVTSSGVVQGFTSMCEGVFDWVERLDDENGQPNLAFICRKTARSHSLNTPLSERLKFIKGLANCLVGRVQRE